MKEMNCALRKKHFVHISTAGGGACQGADWGADGGVLVEGC